MKRRLKLKINGESPRSLFLTFVLAKLNCEIYLYNFITNSSSNKDYQLFLFSKSSRKLLNKFDIWNEIEDISYGFNSLSIKDNLVSEQLLLRAKNFSNKFLNNIGWIARYSDIKTLLINKLIKSDNVHFISKNQLNDESLIYDCELNFINFDRLFKSLKLPLSIFKKIDKQVLIFNVYLRGHDEKRLYEINTSKGLIVLTPLSKNLYQIIWNNTSSRVKETSLSSKSYFLDNLTTLLPNEFKIDQIIGDINILQLNDIYSNYFIKDKIIYFNENKFKSNIIYDYIFNINLNNILQIYNLFENYEHINMKIFNKLLYYFLTIFIEISSNLSFFNTFFNLFIVNNIISLFLRKLLFKFLKRICFINFLFNRNLFNINIDKYNK